MAKRITTLLIAAILVSGNQITPANAPEVCQHFRSMVTRAGEIAPDAGLIFDHLGTIISTLEGMGASFERDRLIYKSLVEELTVLMNFFGQDPETKRNFVSNIITFFTNSQTTIANLQNAYNVLSAQQAESMLGKETQIQNLQAQLTQALQANQVEKQNMLDTIATLNQNVAALQLAQSNLPKIDALDIQKLAGTVKDVTEKYAAMTQERAAFLGILDQIKAAVDEYVLQQINLNS